MLILIFTGCSKISSSSQSSTSVGESTANDNTQIRDRINTLLANNLECINIFWISCLPGEFSKTESDKVKVTSDQFHSFDDLKAFVNDTYVSTVANNLLYNTDEDGHPEYFEDNGVFYESTSIGSTDVLNYDWSHYTFKYTDINSTSKLVTISLMQYSDDPNLPSSKPATITGKVVLENGIWKLSNMTDF
jgi:hypothetical protein